MTTTWFLGDVGESCDNACAGVSKTCDLSAFAGVATASDLHAALTGQGDGSVVEFCSQSVGGLNAGELEISDFITTTNGGDVGPFAWYPAAGVFLCYVDEDQVPDTCEAQYATHNRICPCTGGGAGGEGDPHFTCPVPAGGTRFDFDGHQVPGRRENYTLLADAATHTVLNVVYDTHAFSGRAVEKLFTHMSAFWLSTLVDEQPLELELRFEPAVAFPVLRVSNSSVELESEVELEFVKVHHAACDYMQPDAYVLNKKAGKAYAYPKTSHPCTFLSLELPTLTLEVVAVTAGLEADGVGMNYLNLNVKSWKHSKQLGGIISHCFDASLEEGSCPKCFEDSVTDLHEMSLAKHDAQELADLEELAGFASQGDHEFELAEL